MEKLQNNILPHFMTISLFWWGTILKTATPHKGWEIFSNVDAYISLNIFS